MVQSRQPTGPWRRRYSTASGVSRLRLLQWNETKIGRRLRCSGKPWRMVKSACMYQPEAQDPRPLRDRLVHRRVAVDRHHLEVGVEIVAPELRPGPVAERREQVDQLVLAVEAHAAVADDVRERGDALDVIADVGGRTGRARMPVVHDREHRAPVRRGGSGGRVGVGLDPRPHPVAVQRALRPARHVPVDVPVEDVEDLRGRDPGPRIRRRRRGSRTSSRPHVRRVVVHQRPDGLAASRRERGRGRSARTRPAPAAPRWPAEARADGPRRARRSRVRGRRCPPPPARARSSRGRRAAIRRAPARDRACRRRRGRAPRRSRRRPARGRARAARRAARAARPGVRRGGGGRAVAASLSRGAREAAQQLPRHAGAARPDPRDGAQSRTTWSFVRCSSR